MKDHISCLFAVSYKE